MTQKQGNKNYRAAKSAIKSILPLLLEMEMYRTRMYKTREATERILEMVEEGLLDKDTVIMACLKYMSEDDVVDMAHLNEFILSEDEE
jgi:hypothetical protein